MKSSHLTLMAFCHVLVASIVFYLTSTQINASPLNSQHLNQKEEIKFNQQPAEKVVQPPAVEIVDALHAPSESTVQTIKSKPESKIVELEAVKELPRSDITPKIAIEPEKKVELSPKSSGVTKIESKPVASFVESQKEQHVKPVEEESRIMARGVNKPEPVAEKSLIAKPEAKQESSQVKPKEIAVVEHSPVMADSKPVAPTAEIITKIASESNRQQQQQSPVVSQSGSQQQAVPAVTKAVASAPAVMGGLGPLHLLATTLCKYQPDKLVADENLNQLYVRRASVRKSLFEFMSLKFTNLEKLSSRLGYGLQVVPVKSQLDNKSPAVTPSHGWPVVGKCTAYDLKLMGEAAWCECQEGDSCPGKSSEKPTGVASVSLDEQPAKITSNQHVVNAKTARSISNTNSFLPSPEESSVISKLLHVGDLKDAPTVESTIYNLNLTQYQLATLEAHATSTQECRRNALRYTKALFNHLAEDQHQVSESWPRLYALISSDDCARKRMIDIINALSSFRTDTTSIRRDNLEFAFAMDDLRAKVLESEVNVPLTFDRHFIEVEQFLQQSVRLMLANIQPKRAKLTSMRYRSLMYGASQQAADDQCIDLHQRLLSRNYPNDCNPTQFGQLPDVLRMTASSLELWSIEKELSLHDERSSDYPNSSAYGQQRVNDVNECIANLVSS